MQGFVGVIENFTTVEDVGFRAHWVFKSMSGEAFSLDGVSISGAISLNGVVVPISASKSALHSNQVTVACDALPVGRWPYEIWATDDTGLRRVLVSGCIGVVSTLAVRQADAEAYAARTLLVRMPDSADRMISLQWLSSTLAQDAARLAQEAAADALAAAQDASQYGDAKKHAKAAQEAARLAQEAAADAARMPSIGDNGNWWLGSTDLGLPSQGGDGMDADAITRLYFDDVSELPTQGDYGDAAYVLATSGGIESYRVFYWLTDATGYSQWHEVSRDTADVALKDLSNVDIIARAAASYPDNYVCTVAFTVAAIAARLKEQSIVAGAGLSKVDFTLSIRAKEPLYLDDGVLSVREADMSAYATTTQLAGYATKADIAGFVTTEDLEHSSRGCVQSDDVSRMVALTKAEYDALPIKVATVFYIVMP